MGCTGPDAFSIMASRSDIVNMIDCTWQKLGAYRLLTIGAAKALVDGRVQAGVTAQSSTFLIHEISVSQNGDGGVVGKICCGEDEAIVCFAEVTSAVKNRSLYVLQKLQ